jgi:hypothetical protein
MSLTRLALPFVLLLAAIAQAKAAGEAAREASAAAKNSHALAP